MARKTKAAQPAHTPANDTPEGPNEPIGAGAGVEHVAESIIDQIPLRLLERAPENVRKTASDVAVAELADDIAAHGLLQSLIGYRAELRTDAPVMICGGGRRLQALSKLREDDRVGADYTVPVLIRAHDEAIELSLSENLARRDMNPADEFDAFELLMRPGTRSPADLAKRFGFTERYVRQRLRLAALAPEILDALRNETITLDAAMTYAATQDRALQQRVFKAHSKQGAWDPHKPSRIRQDYSSAQSNCGSALYIYVGAEAYEAAGGDYEDDLFGSSITDYTKHRKLAHGELLAQLAADKMQAEKGAFLAEIKVQHPTVSDVLLTPLLSAGQWGEVKLPKAPKGTAPAKVDNYSNTRAADMWKNADKAGVEMQAVAYIDSSGKLALHEEAIFVPKDKLETVNPPRPSGGYTPETAAQRAAREKVTSVRIMAAQLAVKANNDAKVEGRRFWPSYLRVETMTHPDLGEGFCISQQIFVTPAEIEAQMATADANYDQLNAEREAAKQAEREAEERALQERAAVRDAILALDPPPAVVEAAAGYGGDEGIMHAWYRHDTFDGAYLEHRPGDEGEDDAAGYETLIELLRDADRLGRTWPSIDAYDAESDPGAQIASHGVEAEAA